MEDKTFNVNGEVIEIELNDSEIEVLIKKLKELQDSRAHVHFEFNDNQRELLIHHEEDKLK
ncbi:MAG: hypothetical protein KJ600_02730 [Nanoarchaeota archaeon]|nr:hypothetical protein [Nanoarchaeota archaeon]MBU1103445.1 hypothetical protein [Nanoarchaeota archaeon]